MRVALLRVMPEEHFGSIGIYSDHLLAALRVVDGQSEFVELRVPAWRWPDWRIPMPFRRRVSLRTLGLYLSRWVRYPLVARRLQADVYHIQDNTYGHLAFFLDPRRTVVTSHAGTPLAWRRWNPEGPSLWLFDLAFRGMRRAARIITVSEFLKGELLSDTDYLAGRIVPIHHGIDPIFCPQPPAERERLRASLLRDGEDFLALHVGHVADRKNVEALYQMVALLRDARCPVRLVRVGAQPTPPQADLVRSLGIGQAVTHITHVENSELPAYYAAADVFVFPSLYEGFGIPLIEAMGCATPVVCSDLALFHEVCADAALFVDPRQPESLAAAVQSVLQDEAIAQGLRRSGQQRAADFTWEKTAQATLAVYRSLAEDQ